MSTLQVANIHLESTQNNRIQYLGSNNFSFVAGGANVMVINSTSIIANGSVVSGNVIVSAKTANTYTLQANDSGSTLTFNNTTITTITIPASLPVGYRVYCLMLGTGNVTFTNATGVTMVSSGSNTISTRYGSASVLSYAANSHVLNGI